MTKVALQANSCYNEAIKNIVRWHSATNTMPALIHLIRRCIVDILSQKTCSQCGNTFPATSEFFYPDPRIKKDGFKNPCKACHKAKANTPEERARKAAYMKAYSQSEHGREVNRISADKPENRIKKSIRDKKRRTTSEFKEKQRPIDRAYYHQPENYDRIRAQQKAYYTKPEALEHRKAYLQSRYGTPEWKALKSAHRHIRRAHKNAAPGKYTAQDVQAQFQRQKGKCYWCHKKLTTYHVDHIIPLSRGGSNWPDNIVMACPTCNCSKHNKLPHEWERGGRLF